MHWPAQGRNRLDNPGHYATWYCGTTPEGAAPAHRFVTAEELTPTHRAVESARATLGKLWH